MTLEKLETKIREKQNEVAEAIRGLRGIELGDEMEIALDKIYDMYDEIDDLQKEYRNLKIELI